MQSNDFPTRSEKHPCALLRALAAELGQLKVDVMSPPAHHRPRRPRTRPKLFPSSWPLTAIPSGAASWLASRDPVATSPA